MKRLSDEEDIRRAMGNEPFERFSFTEVARKAEDERDKEWIEWLNSQCPHHNFALRKRFCDKCEEELKAELEINDG